MHHPRTRRPPILPPGTSKRNSQRRIPLSCPSPQTRDPPTTHPHGIIAPPNGRRNTHIPIPIPKQIQIQTPHSPPSAGPPSTLLHSPSSLPPQPPPSGMAFLSPSPQALIPRLYRPARPWAGRPSTRHHLFAPCIPPPSLHPHISRPTARPPFRIASGERTRMARNPFPAWQDPVQEAR